MARKQKEPKDDRRVKLVAPGVLAVGPYQAGVEYEVPSEEAVRLVERKGFVFVDQED